MERLSINFMNPNNQKMSEYCPYSDDIDLENISWPTENLLELLSKFSNRHTY